MPNASGPLYRHRIAILYRNQSIKWYLERAHTGHSCARLSMAQCSDDLPKFRPNASACPTHLDAHRHLPFSAVADDMQCVRVAFLRQSVPKTRTSMRQLQQWFLRWMPIHNLIAKCVSYIPLAVLFGRTPTSTGEYHSLRTGANAFLCWTVRGIVDISNE